MAGSGSSEAIQSTALEYAPWGFGLLVLGLLMAMAMMGAAYLVRDERMENLLWEFGGEEE